LGAEHASSASAHACACAQLAVVPLARAHPHPIGPVWAAPMGLRASVTGYCHRRWVGRAPSARRRPNHGGRKAPNSWGSHPDRSGTRPAHRPPGMRERNGLSISRRSLGPGGGGVCGGEDAVVGHGSDHGSVGAPAALVPTRLPCWQRRAQGPAPSCLRVGATPNKA